MRKFGPKCTTNSLARQVGAIANAKGINGFGLIADIANKMDLRRLLFNSKTKTVAVSFSIPKVSALGLKLRPPKV